MQKKIIKGMTAAPTLLATAMFGLFTPTPAFAGHTCLHYVQSVCVDWERLGYTSKPDCHGGESDKWCPAPETEPAGNPALAATGRKLPRRAAPGDPSTAGAPSASAHSIDSGAK